MHKIIFPSEFGPLADKAEATVAHLGKTLNAQIELMHAIPKQTAVRILFGGDPEIRKYEANEQLQSEAKRLHDQYSLEVTTMVGVGRPDHAIIQAAGETEASLLIFGTKGREGIRASVFGSPVKNVVENSPCPCLTIREKPSSIGYSNLLVVLDPEESASAHLDWSILIAKSQQAEIQLLAHYNDKKFSWEDCDKVLDSAEKKARAAGIEGVKRIDLPWGANPAKDIFIAAQELNTDLIAIMDSHWNEDLKSITVIDSLTAEIVEMSQLPVLTARPAHIGPLEA